MIDIRLVKSDQRGEAHEYYDILIHCQLPPALAEELMAKINKSMKTLEKVKERIKYCKEQKGYNILSYNNSSGYIFADDLLLELEQLIK